MKILVFSDIHGTQHGMLTTLELTEKHNPDLVVVCGDITNFGPATWAEKYLERIPAPTLAVPGNCDPIDLDETIEMSRATNLHRKKTNISGITFIGAGGADYTPFNTPFEFGDDTFDSWLLPLMERNAVLVTHAPAYGTVDVRMDGRYCGSVTIHRLMKEWEPMLMLSGHIHEGRGIKKMGKTLCVNPGAAKNGFGALVEFTTPEELLVTGGREPAKMPWLQYWKMILVWKKSETH